jgi:hypothetical protein
MKVVAIVAVPLTVAFLFTEAAPVAMAQNPSPIESNARGDASKTVARYEGTWNTTKIKKLDGTISCQVKPLAKDRWQGRFWGVWQQVPFDYTVDFAPADHERTTPATEVRADEKTTDQRVRGTATIDGASYQWLGNLTPQRFDVQFTGSRYEGSMQLKRVTEKAPER